MQGDTNDFDHAWMLGTICVLRGNRRRSLIISDGDGYYYHVHIDRESSNYLPLRCIKRGSRDILCRGRAVTSRDGMFFEMSRLHNGHPPDLLFPVELALRRRTYARVSSGDSSPFVNIVRDEGQRGRFPVEVRSRLPVSRLRTSLRNIRLQNLPRIPRNLPVLGEYLLMPQYRHVTQTLDGTDNIFAGYCGVYAEGTVSLVFASQRMMQVLARMRKIFADGTFKKRPNKPASSQLFNISVTWRNAATRTKHTITVVRVFMQKRTTNAYNILFSFLKHLIPQWQPDVIMCDHERAQVNAWMNAFPTATVETCLWHYAVDVFDYARGLSLQPLMQQQWVLDSIVRSCCALPLLPNHMIPQALLHLGRWARQTGFMRMPNVRKLFSYIQREWMGRLQYLSVWGSEDRTNNVSESANATMGWNVNQNRPNVFDIIGAIVRQEDQFMVDVHALSDGRDASRAQRYTSLANDQRIQNLSDSLIHGRITILHFLRAASRTLQAPYDHVFN